MSRHVIDINDKWKHEESSECSCDPSVVVDNATGDIIYVHSDLNLKNGKPPSNEFESDPYDKKLKEVQIEEIEDKINDLQNRHNLIIEKIMEQPDKYPSSLVEQLNAAILSRLDFLFKTKFILTNTGGSIRFTA